MFFRSFPSICLNSSSVRARRFAGGTGGGAMNGINGNGGRGGMNKGVVLLFVKLPTFVPPIIWNGFVGGA